MEFWTNLQKWINTYTKLLTHVCKLHWIYFGKKILVNFESNLIFTVFRHSARNNNDNNLFKKTYTIIILSMYNKHFKSKAWTISFIEIYTVVQSLFIQKSFYPTFWLKKPIFSHHFLFTFLQVYILWCIFIMQNTSCKNSLIHKAIISTINVFIFQSWNHSFSIQISTYFQPMLQIT